MKMSLYAHLYATSGYVNFYNKATFLITVLKGHALKAFIILTAFSISVNLNKPSSSFISRHLSHTTNPLILFGFYFTQYRP